MVDRVDVKLGWSCNNRCRFCVQGRKRERFVDRGTAEALRLLDEARAAADEVVLTGGEVTLRADLPELVRHAAALGFRVIQVQTNGRRLADEALCDALLAAGVTEVSPALHGPTAESHDWLTRAPGSFKETARGIVNVKRRGGRVVTNSVVTRSTAALLADLGRLLVRLGVDQYQLAFPHPLGSAAEHFDSVVPRFEIVAGDLRAGLEPGIRAGIPVMTEAVPLCILTESHRRYAAESIMPRTRIFDAEGVVLDDYSVYRVREGKAKGPPCAECARNAECEGPWREYPERFGWDELSPFRRGG
jgi:MoaA/NifB/PqqE/SkfB family radical SAM enzyme